MTYSMGFAKEFPPNNKIIKQVTRVGQEHSRVLKTMALDLLFSLVGIRSSYLHSLMICSSLCFVHL